MKVTENNYMSVVNLRAEVYFYDKKLLPAYFFSTSGKS